jgi:3-oxoacyl-(acyl-carrier-protein) synthase
MRPFGPDRDGTVLTEASAVLMVETETGARNRGVHPSLEICGFASVRDPQCGREAGAAASVLGLTLESAGIGPEKVGCIVTSGNGSPEGDRAEALALASLFGTRVGVIPACAPKAAFGECLGASGALLTLVAAIALERHCLPPTPGVQENEYGLRLSPREQPFEGKYALVDAFGCGNNAALLLKSI